jgi:hypothetical protein
MSFFFLSFIFFSSKKLENKRTKEILEGEGSSGRRKVVGKGGRKVNMVQKMCTYVCKCKNDTC